MHDSMFIKILFSSIIYINIKSLRLMTNQIDLFVLKSFSQYILYVINLNHS